MRIIQSEIYSYEVRAPYNPKALIEQAKLESPGQTGSTRFAFAMLSCALRQCTAPSRWRLLGASSIVPRASSDSAGYAKKSCATPRTYKSTEPLNLSTHLAHPCNYQDLEKPHSAAHLFGRTCLGHLPVNSQLQQYTPTGQRFITIISEHIVGDRIPLGLLGGLAGY